MRIRRKSVSTQNWAIFAKFASCIKGHSASTGLSTWMHSADSAKYLTIVARHPWFLIWMPIKFSTKLIIWSNMFPCFTSCWRNDSRKTVIFWKSSNIWNYMSPIVIDFFVVSNMIKYVKIHVTSCIIWQIFLEWCVTIEEHPSFPVAEKVVLSFTYRTRTFYMMRSAHERGTEHHRKACQNDKQ